jgi:hypothetical protein
MFLGLLSAIGSAAFLGFAEYNYRKARPMHAAYDLVIALVLLAWALAHISGMGK